MAEWVSLIETEALGPGDREVFDVGEHYVAVFNVDGTYYAVEDICTHDGGPLADGTLDGYAIECPRHGARFDIRDGRVLAPPAVRPVRHFDTRVQDGQVQLLIED